MDKPRGYELLIPGSSPGGGTMNHIDVYLYFTDRFSHKHRSGARKGTSMFRKVKTMLGTM